VEQGTVSLLKAVIQERTTSSPPTS